MIIRVGNFLSGDPFYLACLPAKAGSILSYCLLSCPNSYLYRNNINISMSNRLLLLFSSFFLLLNESHAQSKGILPLTGARYFNEGIWAKNIEVRVDGFTLLNNRIPLNKEFDIKLQLPTGFAQDKAMVFAAVEVNIVSAKGIVLSTTPNVFKDNETKGFPAASYKEVIIKLILKPEMIKAEPCCIIRLRYYDLKSKNQLRLEFPVIIARPGEALQLSKFVNDVRTVTATQGKTSGIKIKDIDVTVDTSIRVAPKMAYASIDMKNIEGSSLAEVLSGKESFWVYDADLNEIKITDKQLKQVGGAMEDNIVNYLSKIPYRLKAVTGKLYSVRFRWESADKRKVIDVVVVK
ncbi:MAG: hypothetical protein ABI741_12035 [Ferruginibacter sp.]